MVQESEIINFILGIVSIGVIVFVFRKKPVPRLPLVYTGFFLVVAGYLLSLVEGFFWHDFFNLLEHLAYALSGVSFVVGFRLLSKSLPKGQESRS